MGCTVGAKIIGQTLLVFKNKDFKVESHSDKLSMEHSHAFGVYGVDLGTQQMAGFSIGVNHHGLAAVNTNVLTTRAQLYDLITERIVLEARTVDDAIEICEQEIQGPTRYQWCNMVVATPEELVAIELTSSDLATVRSSDYVVRTNHHLILKTADTIIDSDPDLDQHAISNSQIRYHNAEEVLKTTTSAEEIHSLLKSHHQEAAICRHGQNTIQDLSYNTVYGYLVTVRIDERSEINFDAVKGPPCMQPLTRLGLEFPLTYSRQKQINARYPW
ncbi:MAG: carcinine hydrolase/isopenicillin-N N-acyltransferase family protein [Candidatus Odinarchaeota archaeon]